MSTFNSTTTTPNFDNLLLDSLLNRLQLRPPPPPPSSQPPSQPPSQLPLSSSFEDFLADLSSFSSSSDHSNSDNDSSYDYYNDSEDETDIHGDERVRKTKLAKEESKLEKEIVKVIMGGKVETLKPNSGQAVSIGDHHVCVGFHEEDGGSGYRVWEWHGHVMLFDDLLGYTPEYVYGNYFERVSVAGKKEKKVEKKAEEKNGGLGLRELIQNGGNVGLGFGLGLGECRVLHRSHNAGLSRVIKVSREE